jgi:regulator of protease activity HflC (stomatin/prohibitin superfamily)
VSVQAQPHRSPRRARSRPAVAWPSVNWPWFALIILLIGYWLFVSSLERIDPNIVLARIFLPDLPPGQAAAATFSPWLRWLVELFHPRVLRHFIPVFAGWWLAVQAAISLMQVLYDCPDRKTAAEFLRRQRRNRPSSTEAPYPVSPKSLADDREKSILLRVGGPVRVFIPNGHAAVTERNARFLRVLPPGVHDLGRFEYLLEVIDLQPQERTARDVSMLTKEGLPVRVDIGLAFRIDPGEDEVTPRRPYPYSEEAVRRAAYSGGVGANGRASSWVDGPLGKVRGALGGMVAEESLDDLMAAPSPRDAHHLLTQGVMRKVWDSLPKDGIKPLRMHIGRLTPPPDVSRQYTEFWLASQRKEDMLARANGTAQLVQEQETARAAAEIAMIQAIVEGLRHAQQDPETELSGYILAERLLAALRQMFSSSAHDLKNAGGDIGQLLSEIHSVDDKLSHLEERLQTPPPKFIPSRSD